MNKTTLFGGALFTAGLAVGAVTQPVSADFAFTDGYINYAYVVGARADGGYLFQMPTAFGPAYFAPINYSGYGLDITAWANPLSMGFTHDRDPGDANWTFSIVATVANFQVTTDTTVQLDWDFGAWDGVNNFIQITDLSGGGADFFQAGGAGSANVSLTAGDEYFFITVSSGNAGGGDSFGTMIIPAPAAVLPLLAAGGLLVSRRRRRE